MKRNKLFVQFLLFYAYSYFIIAYFAKLETFRQYLPGYEYIPLVHLLFALLGFFVVAIITGEKFNIKGYYNIAFYVIVLTLILSLSSIYSVAPYYSLSRSFFAIFLFLLMFIVFSRLIHIAQSNKNCANYLLLTLIISFIFIFLGQILVPEWEAGVGGIRLSGGTNANLVAFLGFFAIFISHYYALQRENWSAIHVACWVLGTICIVWSFSRSVLVVFIGFYAFYIFSIYLKELLKLLKGKLSRNVLKITLLSFVLLVIVLIMSGVVQYIPSYDYIVRRMLGEGGMVYRIATWRAVWPYFTENYLFGSAGWWNLTRLLSENPIPGTVRSPHNLFIRLLAESGILGTIWILLLPAVLFIRHYLLYFAKAKMIHLFLASGLISVFIGQIFEDRYLVGIGSIENGIIMWIVVLAYVKLTQIAQSTEANN